MAESEDRHKIIFDTNAKTASEDVNKLGKSLDSVDKNQQKVESSTKKTADAVSKNGGAMALLNTLTGGYAQTLKDSYEASDLFSGGMGKMLKSVKTFSTGAKAALISTGIGALVVIVGTLVSYWDDIKGLVSGVNSEMKKQGELAEENAKLEEDKLSTLNGQDNILKAQGKSEKEILQIKMKQTDETITALEAQLTQQETIKKAQVDASKRNRDILTGALQFIFAPITLLLKGVDAIGKAFGKDWNVSSIFQKASELIFDPEEVGAEADETIKVTKDKLNTLKNTRAGYQLAIKNIDEEAGLKAKEKADALNEKEKERLDELLKLRLDFENKLKTEVEDLQDKTEEEKLARQKKRAEEEIELLKQKGVNTLEIERLNAEKFAELESELAEKKKEEELKSIRDKREEELNALFESDQKDLELLKEKLNAEQLILDEERENGLIKEEEYNERIAELSKQRKDIATEEAENAKKLEELKAEVRQTGLDNLVRIGQNLQNLAGKNKALAKAGLLIEGAVGAAKIVSDTLQANTKAVNASPLTFGMPWVAVNTVSGALSMASHVKAISTGLKELGGGSAPNMQIPSTGGGAPAQPPQVAFNNTNENQIAQSIGRVNAEQPPIMVNVLESDITTAQGNVKVLETENTF